MYAFVTVYYPGREWHGGLCYGTFLEEGSTGSSLLENIDGVLFLNIRELIVEG